MTNQEIIDHALGHTYMSGVDRDKTRTDSSGEAFTPRWLSREVVDTQIPIENILDLDHQFLDPCGGDGNLAVEILVKCLDNGLTHKQALSKILVIELFEDNARIIKDRLLADTTDQECVDIVNRHVLVGDAIEYKREFDGSEYKYEKQKAELNSKKDNLFSE